MRFRYQHIFPCLNWRFISLVLGMLFLTACNSRPTLPPQQNSYADCWPCAVYTTTFEMIDKVLKTLMEVSCQNALILLGIGLLFWILFYVGKFVTTIQEPDVTKFILPFFTTLLKAIVVAVLLTVKTADGSYALISFVGENLIQPVFSLFAELSTMILDSNIVVKAATQAAEQSGQITIQNTNAVFGNTAGQFLDIVYRIYIALHVGTSLGFAIWQEWSFSSLIFGLLIILMFWALLMTIPMMFIDSIMRICVSLVLLPFALVGWLFPPTSNIIKTLWKIVLNAGITLMLSCFYVALTCYTVMTFAEKYYPGILGDSVQQKDPELVFAVSTMSTSMLGFFVLILCMNRLSATVPRVATLLSGSKSVPSSFQGAFNFGKRLTGSATKAGLALAAASPTLAKEALGDLKDSAKEMAASSANTGGGS